MSPTSTDDEAPIETTTRVSPTDPSDEHSTDERSADEAPAEDPIGTRTRVR